MHPFSFGLESGLLVEAEGGCLCLRMNLRESFFFLVCCDRNIDEKTILERRWDFSGLIPRRNDSCYRSLDRREL